MLLRDGASNAGSFRSIEPCSYMEASGDIFQNNLYGMSMPVSKSMNVRDV